MGRPPLPLGHHGTIRLSRDGDRWLASCRVRDRDGVTRRVRCWASTRAAARSALADALGWRGGDRATRLRPNSRFRDAADLWLAELSGRRAEATLATYRHWLDKIVLHELGELRLVDCDTERTAALLTRLTQVSDRGEHVAVPNGRRPTYSASSQRTVRAIVSGVLRLAVRHQAIPSNPIRSLDPITRTDP